MSAPASDLPPYEPRRLLSAPFPERVRLVCRTWASQVVPNSKLVMAMYWAKYLLLFIGGWAFWVSFSRGYPGFFSTGWVTSDVAFQKFVVWAIAYEMLGLGCGWGPMNGRIKPPMGHDNAWWWEEVAKGAIPIQRCKGCGKLRHPPRPMCGDCGSLEWDHVAASGRGTLHTFTVIRHPQFPGYEFPIIAALVDLEEGTRLMSSLVGCEPAQVAIGMKLVGEIQRDEDGFALPVFRPAD